MRNPWPIGIIVFFVIFVAGMVSFVVWSTHQREDLVSPTYYSDEIRYQQRIDAIKRTQAEGAAPKIEFVAGARKIDIRFPPPAMIAAATGSVALYCPAEAAMDQRHELKTDAGGVQEISAANMKPGRWVVKAEWNSAGKAYYAEVPVFVQ